ncbi:ATP-dependent RecD-like DNA helicase [uncultured archaeon]|nr:ATP-dependent RecD-like DNA helicase [uncultured archaeon]
MPEIQSEIEYSGEFREAFELMENTSENAFITGRAGTGKSTFLKYFMGHTKKKSVVLAPTGVAAINVGGQTIHSFFKIPPRVTADEARKEGLQRKKRNGLYRATELIIIDEISMVRADLLDCIDIFLRAGLGSEKPFAGKQLAFIGDLYQLPPIVMGEEKEAFGQQYDSEYFFSAKAMQKTGFRRIEFTKIYRQKDQEFIGILNRIRDKTATKEDIEKINGRFCEKITDDRGSIYVVMTNAMADEINMKKLGEIIGVQYNIRGAIDGDFRKSAMPADEILHLKKGSQVMFLVNDPQKRWVNGSLGEVTGITNEEVLVKLLDSGEVKVAPHTWEIFRYRYNSKDATIEKEPLGAFTQYPIRLAWAITVHKSQGKTFSSIIIDIGQGTFATGQLYVAFSRATSLEGIRLRTRIHGHHILIDKKIGEYLAEGGPESEKQA